MLSAYSSLPTSKIELPISKQLLAKQAQPTPGTDSTFLGMLVSSVDSVNQSQHSADQQVHALLTGQDVSQAEVMTAVQKADMSFRLLVQIRNKLMAAYEELNSIRV